MTTETFHDKSILIDKISQLEIRTVMRHIGAIKKCDYMIKNGWSSDSVFITHYFNSDGVEVGYYTVDLNILCIFNTPRVWGEAAKRCTAYKWGYLDLWEGKGGRVWKYPDAPQVNLDMIALGMLKDNNKTLDKARFST